MSEIEACLRETEERQSFDYRLSRQDLELARDLLGHAAFHAVVCYAQNGEPAAASVVLHAQGTRAVGWLGGARNDHLRNGVAQLTEKFVIEDLQRLGATGYDLAGANLPTVAAAKASWGGRLLPYYTLEGYSARRLASWLRDWWRFRSA
jgi:hypothetical protein